MRIENIANQIDYNFYELTIIGTEQEVESFAQFTKHTADFIEDELDGTFSITIIGRDNTKKEFRKNVTAELKAFRKANK